MYNPEKMAEAEEADRNAHRIAGKIANLLHDNATQKDGTVPEHVMALVLVACRAAQIAGCPPQSLIGMFTHYLGVAYEADGVKIESRVYDDCEAYDRACRSDKGDDWDTKPTHYGPAIKC